MNAINWFEIPTRNIAAAKPFYEKILGGQLIDHNNLPGMKMSILPYEEPGVGGALIESDQAIPGPNGVLIYLNGGDDLSAILERIPDAGGTVVMKKTLVTPDIGYIALFRDLDGNVLGLHSMN